MSAQPVVGGDLTVAEAARLFDVSLKNLRRRISLGEIPGYQQRGVRGPVWMVSVEAMERAGYARRVVDLTAGESAEAQVVWLRRELEAERARSAELNRRLGYALLTTGRLRGRLLEEGIDPHTIGFGSDLKLDS